jgi:TatD DNase family protein
MCLLLPFDSHNHVHMGPSEPLSSLLGVKDLWATVHDSRHAEVKLSGMAIMSTHPRDYSTVIRLSNELPQQVQEPVQIIPGLGVHPWWLHELGEEAWEVSTESAATPKWIYDLENKLKSIPQAIVGEIGLDGFHFDPISKELVSPIDKQVRAFQLQLELAGRLQRPVSVHCVRSFGPLLQVLSESRQRQQLPPKIYFHAFGGKAGTVDQILALCKKQDVYFGFAPIINFRSPKTIEIVRKIGLDRLLLESDHEDASLVPDSIDECVRFYAEAFETDEKVVIEKTLRNAAELYGLRSN